MKYINAADQTFDLVKVLQRTSEDVSNVVKDILTEVKSRGDVALNELTAKFDNVEQEKPRIMDREELQEYCLNSALNSLSKDQIEAIDNAVANIAWFAKRSMPTNWIDSGPDGQIVGERFIPFERVACYVPQGSFPLVSTAIHTAAIAMTAGVKEIVMVTSPSQGELNPAVAYAAYKSGVTEIVFIGGAQGIAAVAFGTQTIRRVDFICGPGNQFVAEAKRQLFGSVGIDMVAGPSEVFVVADETGNPYDIACDLVAQAEHGSGYEASVLLCSSAEIIESVKIELERIKGKIVDNPGFEKVWENSLYLIEVPSIAKAIEMVNECAPEHVEIQTANSQEISEEVKNAGAIFIGRYSAEPLGDFVAGPSHVLPTNSTARFTSGLSTSSFFTRTSTIKVDKQAYERIAGKAKIFGDLEGLVGHSLSSISRQQELESNKDEK